MTNPAATREAGEHLLDLAHLGRGQPPTPRVLLVAGEPGSLAALAWTSWS